jgi:membrane protein required for beta-lactamase induction
MVSMWLVLWAFVIGGFVGILGFAITAMARREDEHSIEAEKRVKRRGLDGVLLDHEWVDADRWSSQFG